MTAALSPKALPAPRTPARPANRAHARTFSRAPALAFAAAAALAGMLAAAPAPAAPPGMSPAPHSAGTVNNALAAPRASRSAVACLIGPERTADIGSPVIAVVDSMQVDNGDSVRAGQPLVLLRSAVENAGVQAAEERARIDADIRAAEANLTLARQRHTRAVQLREQGFVSPQAIEQARVEQDVAQQKVEQARSQKRVSTRDLGVVRAQLEQRTVRSPFAGVVVDRYVNAGERVDDKPLLRVAMLDPLRVEVVLPAARYGSLGLGDRLQVLPELAGAQPVAATVSQVDRVIDAASNTFRVRLKLPNPGHKLPAGARCRVELPGDVPLAAAAPALTPSQAFPPAPVPAARPKPQAATARPATAQAAGPVRFPLDGMGLALRLTH